MEESIPIVLYNDSFVLRGIVNGLIATATLWVFWTPFILGLVVPLVDAQIKGAICFSMGKMAGVFRSTPMLRDFPSSQTIIANDESELLSANKNVYIAMSLTAFVIAATCIAVSVWMIRTYTLDGMKILKFNIVMALAIVIIEMSLFSGVAMQYSPFDPETLVPMIVSKINAYLN